MFSKRKKCPFCGKKMIYKNNNILNCPDCGYYDRGASNNIPSNNNNIYSQPNTNNIYSRANNTYTPHQIHNANANQTNTPPQYTAPQYTSPYSKPPSWLDHISTLRQNWKSFKKVSSVIITIATIICVIFTTITSIHEALLTTSQTGKINQSDITNELQQTEAVQDKSQIPESDLFKEILPVMFDKSYDKITISDIETVTSYRFYEAESGKINIDYTLSNGHLGTVNTEQDRLETKEINCFVNLEALYLDEVTYYNLDLTGMNRLSIFHANDLPFNFSEMIEPSQLTSLKLTSPLNLDILSQFENLETLELQGMVTINFEGIDNLKNLKNLTLKSITRTEDISQLYKLKNLEQFYIDIPSFDDITFISKMENMRELTIINSRVKNFDLLANCDKLEKLYLLENYEVDDYSFLKNLTNLTELGVYKSFDAPEDVFDFSIYPQLKKLIIGNFDSYKYLSGAGSIEELIIHHGAYTDFKYNNKNVLLDLNNLKILEIHNGSIPAEMLADIKEAKDLEHISFESSYIWDNINPIFELPNLQSLDLTNCKFTLDAKSFNGNESIVSLKMDKSHPYKYTDINTLETENMQHSELKSFLSKLPNLKYISMSDLNF